MEVNIDNEAKLILSIYNQSIYNLSMYPSI